MKLYYYDENDEEYKEYKEEESLCSKCSEFNRSCIGANYVTNCESFKEKEVKEGEGESKNKSCSECIKSVSNGGICSWRGIDGHACANFVQKGNGFETLCKNCKEFNKSCIGATDLTECKHFKEKEVKENEGDIKEEVKEEEGDIKETRTCVDCANSHYHGGKCRASYYNNKICGGFEEKKVVNKEYFRELFEKNSGDNVKHPNHYNGTDSLECIDVIHFALGDDGFAYYCIGNIFKYLWRHDKKNGEEDLKKADQYLQFLEICKPYLSGPVADLAERISDLYEKESVI